MDKYCEGGGVKCGFWAMASTYNGGLGALPKLLGSMAPAPPIVPCCKNVVCCRTVLNIFKYTAHENTNDGSLSSILFSTTQKFC